ncbi:MAG: hypothetical protein NTY35_05420 [Planctomycetota bacterium]|nr:hypothetical protein [Planctomycetota bacterium]
MTDTGWGDEAAAPPKKSGFPKWLLFCGGGCLLAVILGAIVIKLGFDHVKEWGQAEQQLPALQAALPFDPLPPETEFKFAIRFPMDWFIFQDSRGYVMFFFLARAGDGEELRRTVLSPDFNGFGMGKRSEQQEATVNVQGRDVKGLRFLQAKGAGQNTGETQGPSILLEVGPEAGTHVVVVQITRAGSDAPITDEDVRTLLKPFHVGPDR